MITPFSSSQKVKQLLWGVGQAAQCIKAATPSENEQCHQEEKVNDPLYTEVTHARVPLWFAHLWNSND